MAFVDFLLNLAGLLLWLNWCSVRFDPLSEAKASTLAGTLKKAKAPAAKHWFFLAALAALLLVRGFCYWQLGAALDWTPRLDLGATVLPFRSDRPVRMLLFSLLGFGRTLAVFYVSLVFLRGVNRALAGTNPFQKLIRLYLGRLARWPSAVLVLLVVVLGVGIWMALQPLLAALGIVPHAVRSAQLFQQGGLVVLCEALTLRYLVAAFLLAHLLSSYVYLGSHPVWEFIHATGRNLLRPLRWLPLRIGRVDFAPVVAIVLLFFLTELVLRHLPKWNPL